MLKNLFKATIFYYDTHDNPPESPLGKGGLKGGAFKKGWLASLKDNKVLLEKLLSAHLPFKARKYFEIGG